MIFSRSFCGTSPLMAAAEMPRAISSAPISSQAPLVRTNTMVASPSLVSSTRVSASTLARNGSTA